MCTRGIAWMSRPMARSWATSPPHASASRTGPNSRVASKSTRPSPIAPPPTSRNHLQRKAGHARTGACAFSPCYDFRMTARILDGTKIRDQVFAELKTEIGRLAEDGIRPGLAAVLVGENPASQLYVKSKIAACQQLGLASWMH